mgnify:CR=1 FL=1
MNPRWHIAQFFEIRWWRRYLKHRDKSGYLNWKRGYWLDFLQKSDLQLPPGARVLDAGCGLGDGLIALRQAYPQSRLYGLEWSWPLRAACALRCPWAHVRKGDIWRADWRPYEMVYLFQRPESMSRATKKALQQLQPGAWLVSLEFEAPALRPHAALVAPDGRPVWLYQAPFHTKEPIAPA